MCSFEDKGRLEVNNYRKNQFYKKFIQIWIFLTFKCVIENLASVKKTKCFKNWNNLQMPITKKVLLSGYYLMKKNPKRLDDFLLWKKTLKDRFRHFWNQKNIIEQTYTPIWPVSSTIHHWGHTNLLCLVTMYSALGLPHGTNSLFVLESIFCNCKL